MDTLDKIKAGLPALREELKDPDKLSNIYKFSFNFYREDAKNVGMAFFLGELWVESIFFSIFLFIDLQTADKVFEMLLGDRQHIPQIREFLKEQKSFKNIGKDQWTSIYDFSMQVGPNFEGYDPDDGTCMIWWFFVFRIFVIFIS